jgi:hypothetical protein
MAAKKSKDDSGETASFDASSPSPLDPETTEWLYESANATFKSQSDLDESVWRSMSFVAALFALSVAVFREIPPHFSFHGPWPETVASTFYTLGITCFGGAFIYLVWIVWEREFLHPAKDDEVKRYATELTQWYRNQPKPRKDIGTKVVGDMQLFMVDLLAKANDRNLNLIRSRLIGRSRVILFLLFGFAFICASEATMFIGPL